ncbi:MAG: lipoprotein-releasing ABC transporter permease subunit [Gammaproteobacteria bacterium]|nr:lipoprotein-releasing ABC transporter permease subunit [Gammaproteobacteria bacterium]
MSRPFELLVGLRYTRAKRRNHFISFISLTSMIGIALGVMVLITVLSVMNGFGEELRARILGVVSHITVTGERGSIANWEAVEKQASALQGYVASAPFVQGQGMVMRGRTASGVIVRGILPTEEPKVATLVDKIVEGKLDALKAGEFGIVLGRELAWKLGVHVGSIVTLVTPEGQFTPAGLLPRLKRFTVVGIFEVGMYEFDSGLALLHINDAAQLYQIPGRVTGVRIKLDDIYQAPRRALELNETLGENYRIRDWTREHANFFRALKMEKTVMFVIMFFIVAVAAFNIVSTLVMMVADKRAEIAILRTLGAGPKSIMAIFMVQGSIIGVVGTLLGAISGVLLALNVETVVPFLERIFGIRFLAADVYYISDLPSRLEWADVTAITLVSLLMSFFATLYPAWRASQTQPAEALRYE